VSAEFGTCNFENSPSDDLLFLESNQLMLATQLAQVCILCHNFFENLGLDIFVGDILVGLLQLLQEEWLVLGVLFACSSLEVEIDVNVDEADGTNLLGYIKGAATVLAEEETDGHWSKCCLSGIFERVNVGRLTTLMLLIVFLI